MIARVTIYIFLVPVSRYFLPVACDTVLVLIAIKYVHYQNCTTTILQRTGTVSLVTPWQLGRPASTVAPLKFQGLTGEGLDMV